MAIKLDDGYKELLKWLLGIVGGFLLMSLKNSYDNQTETNKQLQQKVDKVYDFSTNHEVRMAVIGWEISKKVSIYSHWMLFPVGLRRQMRKNHVLPLCSGRGGQY